jgi:hypothetical protein
LAKFGRFARAMLFGILALVPGPTGAYLAYVHKFGW